jgi:hypothetical protein
MQCKTIFEKGQGGNTYYGWSTCNWLIFMSDTSARTFTKTFTVDKNVMWVALVALQKLPGLKALLIFLIHGVIYFGRVCMELTCIMTWLSMAAESKSHVDRITTGHIVVREMESLLLVNFQCNFNLSCWATLPTL